METVHNITLKELNSAVQFAEKHGSTKHKTIRIILGKSNGIGRSLVVETTAASDNYACEDITDIESW